MFTSTYFHFAKAVTAMEYIKQLSELIDTDLINARWSFELGHYRGGDWKDAHYDQQKDKILTH
jgi:hypothetical protein